MKVTIKFDDKYEALDAMQGADWHSAMWELDQELRGIVKHGYIGNREAHELEIEAFEKCRQMIREQMEDQNLKFNL